MHKTNPDRSNYIVNIIEKYVDKADSILEIGCGDGGHLKLLKERGYENVTGLDMAEGDLEDIPYIQGNIVDLVDTLPQYDIVFSASCFFLIPPEHVSVFSKIEKLPKKYLMTFEGEVTSLGNNVYGRDYSKIFNNLTEVEHITNMFNEFGHARVFKV